jgi:hypothetical protein
MDYLGNVLLAALVVLMVTLTLTAIILGFLRGRKQKLPRRRRPF